MSTPKTTQDPLADLSAAGVSLWLDDLSRQRLLSGNLRTLISSQHIVGVTTNPSIFQAALTAVISEGISVNVTLIFSLDRYRAVMDAYLAGLEQARANGHQLSYIHSVASFFVSRVDLEIDKRLNAIGTPEAQALLGAAAIANARLAYQAHEQTFAGDRWDALTAAGANKQRPLWASTGVKDPAYDDTRYVVELVAPGTVNTAPENTINAVADHGVIRGNTIAGTYGEAAAVFTELAALGIDLDDVFAVLEAEGVEKFQQAWTELLDSVATELQYARQT